MKACPGLRSGIDRSSNLSLVIRDIPSSFRPLDSSFRRSKAGPVPRYGAGIQRGWTEAKELENYPNQLTRFSYLGVPAASGLGDYFEGMSRTPILDRLRHGHATPMTATWRPQHAPAAPSYPTTNHHPPHNGLHPVN